MSRRDIVIGLIVLGLLAVLIFRLQTPTTDEELVVPQTLSVEDQIEDRFNLEIPEDVDKAELKDVSGGSASAIATRKLENGTFTHTILADLPDPDEGMVYEGRLVKDDSEVNTGNLRVAKGGFLLDYQSDQDLTDHNKVRVVAGDRVILEGEF